jgi:predicted amidohydrolase
MRCVLLQSEPTWQDLASSRTALAAMLAAAGDVRGALVLTPEMAESGFTMHPERACDGDSLGFAAELARRHGCFLQYGFVRRCGDAFENVLALLGPDGAELALYAKNHLFSPAGEPKAYRAGDSIALADIGGLRTSPFICYDLRFPELWRLAALSGAEVLTLSACWPQVRQAHWRALTIARAIENQAFVLACNRVGSEPNAQYGGGSLVVAPDGEVLAEAGSEKTTLFADMDAARVRGWRERFPALRDTHRSLLGRVSSGTSPDSARLR